MLGDAAQRDASPIASTRAPDLLLMRTRPFRPEGQHLFRTVADNVGALMKDDPGARRDRERVPRRADTKTVQLALA